MVPCGVSCVSVLVLLSGAAICNGFDSLYPLDVGLFDEDPFLPNERDSIDDCHMRYLRYGRDELKPPRPLQPSEENQEHSHVASIGWTRSTGTIDWACMGALIWENFVLTSAHCTADVGNIAPDVIRLGEDSAGQYIQQRKIKQVIRHPEYAPQSGLNDIALLQLDRRVIVNNTVTPACLWMAPGTVFPQMQALAKVNAAIESVELGQTQGSKCASSAATQLCMEPSESEPSECSDSPAGQLLQVRLLHNFKTSPFVVGIMAGNGSMDCGSASAFTRLGNYADWIVEALKTHNSTATPIDLVPPVCALRYAHFRPAAEDLLTERFDEVPYTASQAEWRHADEFKYIVRIVWPAAAGRAARNDCAGTFVDQRTILTLAECVATTPEGHKPSEVIHSGRHTNTSLPIQSITVHPRYVRGSLANNLAVIKLTKADNVVPACIWTFDEPLHSRVDLAGVAPSGLVNIIERSSDPENSFPVHHLRAVDYAPLSDCTAELARLNQTLGGVDSEQHVCFWNDQWIVPASCGLLPGGPVQRYVARAGAFLKYVYALSVAGPSCGYGLPALAIVLQPHIPWLQSVMMESASGASATANSDSVIVINPDLKRSDECNNGDGTVGICVPHELCTSTPDRLRRGERVTLCSVGSVVCCPWGDIARNAPVHPVRNDLERCEARSHPFRKERLLTRNATDGTAFNNFPHLAEIGWAQNAGRIQFNCMGYLVTTNTIISSAQCIEGMRSKPTVARVGSLNAGDSSEYLLQPIRRVTVHEEYDDVTGLNNLALIQLTTHITPSASVFPGCLFRNTTHVPVRQVSVSYDGTSLSTAGISPLYGADCREQRPGGEALPPGQMCYMSHQPEDDFRFSSAPCFTPGDMMVWTHPTEEQVDDANYLVAIFNYGTCREAGTIQTATRIGTYYDWIVANIK